MKREFAKKVIIKSQRQFMYGLNFHGSDVIAILLKYSFVNPGVTSDVLKYFQE